MKRGDDLGYACRWEERKRGEVRGASDKMRTLRCACRSMAQNKKCDKCTQVDSKYKMEDPHTNI